MTAKPKIIIAVDDNIEILTAIKNTLKDIYEVYPTPSASEMFNELLEHIRPDLILLDVEMPGMNGYEAAKILKCDDKLKEIPIIFLTSMNDANSEMEGLTLGAVDYIHKPFFAPLLLQRIKLHISLIDHQIEAENASRSKGEFLSHMSHEIRTPLNAIMGMMGIAQSTDDLQKIKQCIGKAVSASKQLLGIVNNILDMSKIEANKFELSCGEFDFEKMLMGIINVTNVRAEEKQLNFIVHLNVNVPAFIIGDELRLSQVITNLLTNAIKFTPENGKIILNIEKTGELDGEVTLKIEVTDTGIGISAEQQKRLFTSYNQADSNITKNFGGTGLGLVISKRIVELMQGQIWIESELGKGSKFIFTIKVKRGNLEANIKLSSKIRKDDIRILAVDDSMETRVYFSHVMEAFHLPCDTASGATEAMEKIKKAGDMPYNIFFIDWHMPEMDGIELTKIIKEISGENTIVIMFSTADWSSIEKEATAAGVKQFVPKPIFPSMLINAINDCIGISLKIDSGQQEEFIETNFDFNGHSILIAEDIEINREIMTALLEGTGISIDFAENGKQAVSIFEENPDKYGLILMDVNMPEMDGYEATKTIRALNFEEAKYICIIAMTANVFKEDIEKCLSVGMNDHIGKPVDLNELLKKLNKYLASSVNKGGGI